jgi:hypothetical protein
MVKSGRQALGLLWIQAILLPEDLATGPECAHPSSLTDPGVASKGDRQ